MDFAVEREKLVYMAMDSIDNKQKVCEQEVKTMTALSVSEMYSDGKGRISAVAYL